ncbi:MAG: hypothetical protein BGO98_29525 [Myxococcales bacterium 68-20]|nr:MAG: hypothetical protein BGO98_29525 [Myxococcales bacterium 68-20]
MVPDLVLLNGTPFSYHSVSLRYDNIPLEGFLGFDWEEGRERAIVYAGKRSGVPIGRTAGKVVYAPMNLKLLESSANTFLDYLTLKGLGSWTTAEFTLTLSRVERDAPPIVTIFGRCTADKKKNSYAEGVEASAVDFTLSTLSIVENGRTAASLIRSIG